MAGQGAVGEQTIFGSGLPLVAKSLRSRREPPAKSSTRLAGQARSLGFPAEPRLQRWQVAHRRASAVVPCDRRRSRGLRKTLAVMAYSRLPQNCAGSLGQLQPGFATTSVESSCLICPEFLSVLIAPSLRMATPRVGRLTIGQHPPRLGPDNPPRGSVSSRCSGWRLALSRTRTGRA
jgi:hypothetical protein